MSARFFNNRLKRSNEARCPRCNSVDHNDPEIHNQRIEKCLADIQKMRDQVADMPSVPELWKLDAIASELDSVLDYATGEVQYADSRYHNLECLRGPI